MNKKTVLFLINGFGVEKKESYSIYDSSLMPTFDDLTKNYLFSTIDSKVSNYYDGYRNASLDVSELYNYSIIDNDIVNKTFVTKENLVKLKNEHEQKKGNLHIFCLVDTSLKIVDHLKETLKFLNPNNDKNKKIYLHLIISSNNIDDYKYLVDVFSHLNIELGEIAPIGFILGLSSIDNTAKQVDLNFFFRMFISKVGEKWQSFKQKFDVLYGTKTIPRNTKPFIVNSSFNLTKDDTFFFFNYDNINLTNFLNTLANISYGEEKNNYSYYSLFSVTSNLNIPYMYETTFASNSLVSNLENINATATILADTKKIGIINYFCNGLKNEVSNRLNFIDVAPFLNNPTALVSAINQLTSDLIIINYDIDNVTKTLDLKEKLKLVDILIKAIYDNMNGSKYTFIISSLFGMSKIMINEKGNICQVIFTGKVPFIYIDDFITKKDYLIEPGNINDIFKSTYKSIKSDSKYDSIVEKKNGLYKLFFK